MPVKVVKPTSPGRRKMSYPDFSSLTKKKAEKKLSPGKKRISGRNSHGHITVRRRGGGHKRRHRIVDFNRTDKLGIPGTVQSLEYDPNRTAWIALLFYVDGEKRYVLAPEGLKEGDQVVCGERTKVKTGNRMQLKHIPTGYKIYNVQIALGKKGSVVPALLRRSPRSMANTRKCSCRAERYGLFPRNVTHRLVRFPTVSTSC